MYDAAGGGEREGGCVRPAKVDGTSGLACLRTALRREITLSSCRTISCWGAVSKELPLDYQLLFSVPDTHPETERASVWWRWLRLTSHCTACPRGQRAAGDSVPGRFVNPQKKRLKLLLLLLLLLLLQLLLPLLLLLRSRSTESQSIEWARYVRGLLRALVVAAAAV